LPQGDTREKIPTVYLLRRTNGRVERRVSSQGGKGKKKKRDHLGEKKETVSPDRGHQKRRSSILTQKEKKERGRATSTETKILETRARSTSSSKKEGTELLHEAEGRKIGDRRQEKKGGRIGLSLHETSFEILLSRHKRR